MHPGRANHMLSHNFPPTQVLFALNDLGIPEFLNQHGPSTAAQITTEICPEADPEWVERLLRAAAAFGMVKRTPARQRRQGSQAVADESSSECSGVQPGPG